MRIFLLYSLVFGALPLVLFQPYIGTLLWVWIAYMAPHKFTWGAAYYFPFAQVVAIATIGAWLISNEPKRLPLTGITGVMLVFAGWITITTFYSLAPIEAERKWDEVIKVIAMSLITYLLIQSKRRIFWLIATIVFSIGFIGVKGGIFVLLTGGEYRVYGPPQGNLSANNAIGLGLAMVLPLARYLQTQVQYLFVKWSLSIMMALSVLAIFATYSRGAFLALIAVVAYMLLRSRRAVLVAMILVVGGVLGATFMPEKWSDRGQSIQDYEMDLSAMSRLRMWRYGWSVATARPILGGGFGVYPATEHYTKFGFALCEPGVTNELTANCTMKGRSAHNIFMEVLGEHGFVGLAIYILLAVLAFTVTGWLRRLPPDRPDLQWAYNLAGALQASMVGFFAAGMFLNKAYLGVYYHLIVIAAAAAVVVRRELAKEPAIPGGVLSQDTVLGSKSLKTANY